MSFAENPELTEAPSQPPASTTTKQTRPNAINSSPAEISTRNPRVEPPGPNNRARTRKCHPSTRLPARPLAPHFGVVVLSWRGLLLERTKRQENDTSPKLSFGIQGKSRGNPTETPDRAAMAVSNNRVNEV